MSSSDPTGGATTLAVQQHDAMYRQLATAARPLRPCPGHHHLPRIRRRHRYLVAVCPSCGYIVSAQPVLRAGRRAWEWVTDSTPVTAAGMLFDDFDDMDELCGLEPTRTTSAGPRHALRDERAAFFADKATHLLHEIAEYENTHPDDAPCLHSQHVEIDGKQVTIKLHEWNALHTAARQSDPIPESSLPRDSEIFRVVCDRHVNGHGVVGGWYTHVQSARDSIEVWWKRMHPTCTGWRVEIRRLSPWEPVDD